MRRLLTLLILLLFSVSLFPQSGEGSAAQTLEREAALETARRIIEADESVERQQELDRILTEVIDSGTRRQADEARYLRFLAGGSTRQELEASLQRELEAYRNESSQSSRENGLFWASAAGGVAGMSLFGLFSGLYSAAYGDYLDATDPDEAERLEDEWHRWDFARYASLGIGTASLTAAALLFPTPASDTPANLYTLRYKYAGLEGSAALRMETILQDRADLMARLQQSRIDAKPYLTWRNISLISGGTFLAATATFLILGDIAFKQYNEAQFTTDAEDQRKQVELYSLLGASSGIATAISLSAAGALELMRPHPEDLADELLSYDAFIEQEFPGTAPAR